MAAGLATRCSACGTVFRVVTDQLRVSEGWVRCGRCAQVFNAAEALLDLETGAPRRLTEDGPVPAPWTPAPASPMTAVEAAMLSPEPVTADAAAHGAGGRYDSLPDGQHDSQSDSQPDSQPDSEPEHDAQVTMPVTEAPASRLDDPAAQDTVAEDPRAEPDDRVTVTMPTFVRQADRAARWRSPRIRAALGLLLLLGLAGIAAQVVYVYRDLMAARYPALRPTLEQACVWLDCKVGAARSIEGLTVESSGLVRVEKSSIYRLSAALRNGAGIELALPALELTLTDGQGRLIARRVLNMGELGVTQGTLAPGREVALQATLQAATAPVAGYTVELFYP